MNALLLNPGSGDFALASSVFPEGWFQSVTGECSLECQFFGRVDGLTAGDTVTFRLYVWPTGGGAIPALHTVVWTAGPQDNDVVFHAHMRAVWDPSNNIIVGFGDAVALDVGGGPAADSHAMPAETVTPWWNPTQPTTAYGSIQVTGVNPLAHNFSSNIQSNQQMDP